MASVDELYLKKQQEISQATRTSRNIRESQNRITSLENDRALSRSRYELTEERNKSQQIIIYSLIGGLALFLIAAYFTYKYIKQQRLANNLLALKSLRSQMNPHFIFNALNSVNSFIASNDERTANKYLSDFSFLMRAVLENSEEDFIPLEKEIELLELYTKLEHFRFKDKFEYVIYIDKSIGHRQELAYSLYFDTGTGDITRTLYKTDWPKGSQAWGTSRFLHTGEYFGFIGQTIAGLVSLLCCILVYTGTLLGVQRLLNLRKQH